METLPIIEITSPIPYEPKVETLMPKRKTADKTLNKVPVDKWINRLALDPEKSIKNTLEETAQLALNLESDNRTMPKRHHKSRFPFFKHPRLRDEFHDDEFYPDVRSAQNHACAQTLTGKHAGHCDAPSEEGISYFGIFARFFSSCSHTTYSKVG